MVRNKTQLSIYIVGAMLVADFVLFGYWPSRQRLEVLQQAQGKQRSLISLADAHRRQLPALRERLAQCEQALGPYQDRVPVQREFGSFLQDVSGLMTQHHLQEQDIRSCAEMPVEGLTAVPVAVRCKGQLTDLFGFYRQLGSIKRLVRVDKVRFTNDPGLSGRVQMDAQMVIFYRPGTSSLEGLASSDLSSL